MTALQTITGTIAEMEKLHGGEIRFAVEACLHFHELMAGRTAGERAAEVFSQLRVWDTDENNGVLIYVLLADRHIEIVADRGYRGLVSDAEWQAVCAHMEQEFRQGRFEAGAVHGIREVSALIARHFRCQPHDRNELSDDPVMLG
jgi:uncharacterized membrane protein